MNEKFEQYCIVELFGHSIIAGLVGEQEIGGQVFVRVDVPEIEGIPAFTKFYGTGAIYCMTPCDKDTALAAVSGLRQKPVEVWKLNLPRIEAPQSNDGDDGDDGEY